MPIGGLKEANEKIMAGGVGDCAPEELLLVLLKYDGGGKYETGNEYCRAILERFGGVNGLARARAEELTTFTGLGCGMATIVKAAMELGMRAQRTSALERPLLNSPRVIYEQLAEMRFLDQEEMVVLALDTRMRLMRKDTVYRGTLNTTVIRTAELFRPAMAVNACSIVLAHNHPSGDPTPSPEDVAVTRVVYAAGQLLDIELVDHVVVGDGNYRSLKEAGYAFVK